LDRNKNIPVFAIRDCVEAARLLGFDGLPDGFPCDNVQLVGGGFAQV